MSLSSISTSDNNNQTLIESANPESSTHKKTTQSEFINDLVASFLLPYITGQINRENEPKDRKSLIEYLAEKMPKWEPKEEQNIKEMALKAYVKTAALGLYVNQKSKKEITSESPEFKILMDALEESLPKDFDRQTLRDKQISILAAQALWEVNGSELSELSEAFFFNNDSTSSPSIIDPKIKPVSITPEVEKKNNSPLSDIEESSEDDDSTSTEDSASTEDSSSAEDSTSSEEEVVFRQHKASPDKLKVNERIHKKAPKINFRIEVQEIENEKRQIYHLDKCTNKELKTFLSKHPNIEYLVVTGTKVTKFPPLDLKLKMLCVNGCTALQELPKNYKELKSLHCSRTSLKNVPETYTKLEVIDCHKSKNLMSIPKFRNLKFVDCRDCDLLSLKNLKNVESIICNSYQKKHLLHSDFVAYDSSVHPFPKALKDIMHFHAKSSKLQLKNLYINPLKRSEKDNSSYSEETVSKSVIPTKSKNLNVPLQNSKKDYSSYPEKSDSHTVKPTKSVDDLNIHIDRQISWLYPFWMMNECNNKTVLAHAFGLKIQDLEKEMSKICRLDNYTDEELEIFLKENPDIEYLVVTGPKVTKLPPNLKLKMLCVNGCTSLHSLPENYKYLNTLHCNNTSIKKIPESYTHLEVIDCHNSKNLMHIPMLLNLKLVNCTDCDLLSLRNLHKLDSIICSSYQKQHLLHAGFDIYNPAHHKPPEAIQYMMHLYHGPSKHTDENLYINKGTKNNNDYTYLSN